MLGLPRIPQAHYSNDPRAVNQVREKEQKRGVKALEVHRIGISGHHPPKPRNGGAGHPESGRVEIKERGPKVWVGFWDASLRKS